MKKLFLYFKLIRIKHWIKNLLIFLPLFFNGSLFNKQYFINSLFAFFIFCLISSIVYIINDINDIEYDKMHETKKERPLASGKLSIPNALTCIVILLFILIGLFIFSYTYIDCNKWLLFLIPITYLIINILYSRLLKNIVILDVFIIVIGFLLRLIYGSVVTGIIISNWLYLMIIFISFYLAFGKRRNEFIKNGSESRKSLKGYNFNFLDKNMYLCLTISIICYSLWCANSTTIERIGNNYLIWSILILLSILFTYNYIIENESDGDPIEVLLSSKILCLLVVVFCTYVFTVLYLI